MPRSSRLCVIAAIAWAGGGLWLTGGAARAQGDAPDDGPTPRSITDIAAILDQERPDPERIRRLRDAADRDIPADAEGRDRGAALYARAQARSQMSRYDDAIADMRAAVALAEKQGDTRRTNELRQYLANLHSLTGDGRSYLDLLLVIARDSQKEGKGRLFSVYRLIAQHYINLGDLKQAASYVAKLEALLTEVRNWSSFASRAGNWQGNVEAARARLLEARGRYRDAEAAYTRAEMLRREVLARPVAWDGGNPLHVFEQGADQLLLRRGRTKARQGRYAEGEADVRRALLSRLRASGKYSADTAQYVGFLSDVLVEQGRTAEAERLTRIAIEILEGLGVPPSSRRYAGLLNDLAVNLNLQSRWREALDVYERVEAATVGWPVASRERFSLNPGYVQTLYNSNNLPAGLAAAERLLARNVARYGDKHFDTALARGLMAIGLAKSGRLDEARRGFEAALPVLFETTRTLADDDPTAVAAREQRVTLIIEAYMALMARTKRTDVTDPALDPFRLVDRLRGRSVQRALAEASVRATAKTPALAKLARELQDLEKQFAAQLGLLNVALGLPPGERDAAALAGLQADVDRLKKTRDTLKGELQAKFQNYGNLITPVPPSWQEVQAVLRPDEAMVAIHVGTDASYIWAIPKQGRVAFAQVALSGDQLTEIVRSLRLALEPSAEVVDDIPSFDTGLAYRLFATLLEPVAEGWRPAKSLVVATNAALGSLPIGVLPTARPPAPTPDQPTFVGYRAVPWLARTHAVAQVPSASSFVTLRRLPPASAKREKLIGYGDPLFAKEQMAEAGAVDGLGVTAGVSLQGRSLKLRAASTTLRRDSARLAALPRLPDTADELRDIARSLAVDPAIALNLGTAANEQNVKTADLARYRVVAFATHGLLPGELDGLDHPALALTAPNLADVDGDGLLTMDEVLALKLDADWVVLSACNTGSGAGAGADAASGLARAFFYAGSRSLLVTNWSVHSASARDLVSDLFRRQSAGTTTRAEALRAAMMALMDGPGYMEEGASVYTYAHPIFWAPYTLIGDGG